MAMTTATSAGEGGPVTEKGMKFSDILADPRISERWQKVKKWFFLRESTYDMTNRCNIRCNGCYYYEGDKQFARENKDPEAWRQLMQAEKARGITYVVLAGAEPSLVPELCKVCYQEMPLGAIATNGLIRMPESIQYKIRISVWASDETSLAIRKAKNMLERQIENYRGDPRAVFVYTFTQENIDQAGPVARALDAEGCRLTFNMFSAPVGYAGNLRHTAHSLRNCRTAMTDLLGEYPQNVLFSPYSAVAHTGYAAVAHVAPNRLLMYGAQAFELGSSGLGQGAFGVLLMRLTQKRFSATQYALLSSLFTLPRILAGPVTGVLADAMGWRDFFVLTVVFGIPGMGRYFITSITNRDYPVITGTILLYAVILVLANLVVDMTYAWLDPRIRFD